MSDRSGTFVFTFKPFPSPAAIDRRRALWRRDARVAWRRHAGGGNLFAMRIARLTEGDVALIGAIDRSEHVDLEYAVIDGQLRERPVTMTEIPSWETTGSGPYSVRAQIKFCASLIADGAVLLGAFDEEGSVGLAVVDPSFEARMAWLAFLHVDRLHRRRGVARALWEAALELGLEAGAESIYVSATPTGSAVGFYLRQGCQPADPPHPELLEHEPEDIHFVCALP